VLNIDSSRSDTYAAAKFISRWLIVNSKSHFRECAVPVCPADRNRIPQNAGVSILKTAIFVSERVSERESRTKMALS